MDNATPYSCSTARKVGALMLSAFLTYGIGSTLATTAESGSGILTLGAVLMLINSAVVIAIGLLMLPVLRVRTPKTAVAYLVTRLIEGIVLAIGVGFLLVTADGGNFLAYNIAMAGLGIGSLFFCVALYRSRLVPRFLAVWGFIGYASFAMGSVLELAGVAGAGLVSTVPGGLFEVFFAIWLIVKGFNATARIASTTAAAVLTPVR